MTASVVMKACIKVTYGYVSKRCSNLTFIFEILKLSITFNLEKSTNSFGDMVSYTQQFKHKNNQKASFSCTERCWMLYVPM